MSDLLVICIDFSSYSTPVIGPMSRSSLGLSCVPLSSRIRTSPISSAWITRCGSADFLSNPYGWLKVMMACRLVAVLMFRPSLETETIANGVTTISFPLLRNS